MFPAHSRPPAAAYACPLPSGREIFGIGDVAHIFNADDHVVDA